MTSLGCPSPLIAKEPIGRSGRRGAGLRAARVEERRPLAAGGRPLLLSTGDRLSARCLIVRRPPPCSCSASRPAEPGLRPARPAGFSHGESKTSRPRRRRYPAGRLRRPSLDAENARPRFPEPVASPTLAPTRRGPCRRWRARSPRGRSRTHRLRRLADRHSSDRDHARRASPRRRLRDRRLRRQRDAAQRQRIRPGFDRFETAGAVSEPPPDARGILAKARSWIDGQNRGDRRRAFVWIHLMEPHEPFAITRGTVASPSRRGFSPGASARRRPRRRRPFATSMPAK